MECSVMIDITSRDFDREVLKRNLAVFTCFTTKWGHSYYHTCLFADELDQKYSARLKFVKVEGTGMTRTQLDHENQIRQRIAEEGKGRQRVDEDGTRWSKDYFGGGTRFRNWLSQFV
jgi:hypothetical protein